MPQLRIMTANLWGPQVDPIGLRDVLAAVDPDVLAVQELDPPAADVIAGCYLHARLDPVGQTMGSGIAARRPAVFSRIHLRYRSGWSAMLEPSSWPGLTEPLEVVSMHMANPAAWPWWRSVGHRRYQLAGLLTHCDATPVRRVIVGDFNASPAWPLYRQLRQRFSDGAAVADTTAGTWRFQARTPPLLRIDHAFGDGVDFVSTEPVEVPGSDHLGLVVDVSV
ncbi:MAG TPA: endonuclease/exonuclease/phosphatase family protein [Acidimicrobiia bacterium]|nr:endonuclease/exonuclease/phosphatase family protein [Acidimicrobiia bacterium]